MNESPPTTTIETYLKYLIRTMHMHPTTTSKQAAVTMTAATPPITPVTTA